MKASKNSSPKSLRKFDETFKRESVNDWLSIAKSTDVISEELGLRVRAKITSNFGGSAARPDARREEPSSAKASEDRGAPARRSLGEGGSPKVGL